jgi:FkbM family methyltransferase
MKLYQNTMFGLRHGGWTRSEAVAYFIKGVARELKIAPDFFSRRYKKISIRSFKKKWLKQNGAESYFDFNGVKLPDVSNYANHMGGLMVVFGDTFLFHCFQNDNYNKDTVVRFDRYMGEGPYGYTDGTFDVTVKKNDVVIDAGAWIGDFSAYAAYKGATSYAFEPVNEVFQLLSKTKKLNNINDWRGGIYPVQKGLSDSEREIEISICSGGAQSSIVIDRDFSGGKISVTTIDKFVEENKLERVDFIKADIEGAERDMLRGAANVLKTFAPKLALCTYHLPDDPEVLEQIIKEANPDYTVVQMRHKLFACVVPKQ